MRTYWAAMDIVIILVFVGIGRFVHDHGVNAAGMASTTWPFAGGLAVAWLSLAAWRRSGLSPSDGAIASVLTVLVAMILRVVSGQGIAVAFVFVALAFLGVSMVGWRALLAVINRWRA